MRFTSEIYQEITESINLSPAAEGKLKKILKGLDSQEVIDDLESEDEE